MEADAASVESGAETIRSDSETTESSPETIHSDVDMHSSSEDETPAIVQPPPLRKSLAEELAA